MKRVPNKESCDTNERGAVIAELALMLPLMAILVLGAIDIGLIVREHQILQNAAREGTRFSVLLENCIVCRPVACSDCPGGCGTAGCKTQSQVTTEIKQRIVDYLQASRITGVTASDITIDQSQTTTINGIAIGLSEVTVTYNRSFLFSGGSLFQFNTVSLQGRSVFRNLY